MRLFYDTLIALMLAGILCLVLTHKRHHRDEVDHRETARTETRRFQQQVTLQAAIAQVNNNHLGFPGTIDPDWFTGSLPTNPLLGTGHPWVEIAAPEDRDLKHPVNRIALDKSTAKFWYNPSNGCVRARVPAGVSDAAAVEMYNFINECELPALFADASTN